MFNICPLVLAIVVPVDQVQLPSLQSWDITPDGRLVPVVRGTIPKRDTHLLESSVLRRYESYLAGENFISAHVVLSLLFQPSARGILAVDESGFEGNFNGLQFYVQYGDCGQKIISYPEEVLQKEQIFWKWKTVLESLRRNKDRKSSVMSPSTKTDWRGPVVNDRILWKSNWTASYVWGTAENVGPISTNAELLEYLSEGDRFVAAHLLLGIQRDKTDFLVVPTKFGFLVIADRLRVELHIDKNGNQTVVYPDADDQMYRLQNLWRQRLQEVRNADERVIAR